MKSSISQVWQGSEYAFGSLLMFLESLAVMEITTDDRWKPVKMYNTDERDLRFIEKNPLRKKCPYSVLFWSVFSGIRTEYGEIFRNSPYSVQMLENTDQNNSEYGYFSCSDWQEKNKVFWCKKQNETNPWVIFEFFTFPDLIIISNCSPLCSYIPRKSPYSVRIQENTDQKKLRMWTLWKQWYTWIWLAE